MLYSLCVVIHGHCSSFGHFSVRAVSRSSPLWSSRLYEAERPADRGLPVSDQAGSAIVRSSSIFAISLAVAGTVF